MNTNKRVVQPWTFPLVRLVDRKGYDLRSVEWGNIRPRALHSKSKLFGVTDFLANHSTIGLKSNT